MQAARQFVNSHLASFSIVIYWLFNEDSRQNLSEWQAISQNDQRLGAG